MKAEKSFTSDVSPQRLCAAMRDPGLIEQQEKARDALDVQVVDLEKSDGKHTFRIEVENYARGLTGVAPAEQQAFLNAHGDLYHSVGDTVCLRVAAGELAIGSLDCIGFASRVLPDTSAMTAMPVPGS